MTWVKLDDTCPDHPSIVGLTDAAFACWVRGLCYSSRHLTDGFIPTVALRALGTPRAARELVAEGRWEVVEGGWRVHGYEDKQRTRRQVEQEREKWRERQDRHRGVTGESRRDMSVSHGGVTPPEVEVETERYNPPTPLAELGRDIDLEHHPIPRLPDDLRERQLTEIAALKASRRPELSLVENNPAKGATA